MSQTFYDWLVERMEYEAPHVHPDTAIRALSMLDLVRYLSEYLENHR